MNAIPITFREAQEFVRQHHRHHGIPRGHRFSVGAVQDGQLCGVAIVGRPVARQTAAYTIAEVTRLCTNGTRNACSFLYALVARIAALMGYAKIQTFILTDEPGTSLVAAGWQFEALTKTGAWDNRPGRGQLGTTEKKQRWVRFLTRNIRVAA